ncbi:GNAT family N-acetyltransferase [Vibrio mexicanus]|uniref:GNAT family N-acetyltransferase n=1 Tax=Vibrio mexicanus TaxID=1004326 RepID=UPI00063CD822|nr:GNAT family N-acetyltransferase [Vibrio mexicanus]
MLRQLQAADKDKMLTLVSNTQMFEADEIAYIAESFDETKSEAIWFGKFADDQMIGVAYCVPMEMTNRTWNVLMLLVDLKFHRQGIGKALMNLMEQTLAEQGQRLLIVETSSTEDFQTARAFYHGIGYTDPRSY